MHHYYKVFISVLCYFVDSSVPKPVQPIDSVSIDSEDYAVGNSCLVKDNSIASGKVTTLANCKYYSENLSLNEIIKYIINPIPEGYEDDENYAYEEDRVCCPITTETRNSKRDSNKRIVDTKCEEYSKLVFNDQLKVSTIVAKGLDTSLGEFPHMAVLYYGESHNCGGFLISNKYILTAKHCWNSSVGDAITKIKLGATNLELDDNSSKYKGIPPQEFKMKNFIIFDETQDIALIELDREVIFNENVRPICLSDKFDYKYGTVSILTGYGAYFKNGRYQSKKLLKGYLDYMSGNNCQKQFKEYDASINFCAGSVQAEQHNACPGDSGSPLQQIHSIYQNMYTAFGIVSLGHGAGCALGPVIFLRIDPFIGWIEKIVWPNEV